ncbi:MAG: tandem-95 repeat protein, partial [Anaerolineales bacterium]|nr:tandem-95 repeat protein [Anaerolineales bacterium]
IYYGSGGVMAQNAALPTYGVTNGVGNFDADPEPEFVLVYADPDYSPPFNGGNNSQVYLLDHQMNIIWGPVVIPKSSGAAAGGNGGPPTVADFDGDGLPEIGIAGHSNYAVIDTDGTILWLSVTQDYSSGFTGSSVFDFQGDGRSEVVYADERYLRIYDGPTGNVLFQTPHASITGYELPVTADVDGDGHAEIVAATNNFFCGIVITCGGNYTGIRVYESASDTWANTRRIWHEHAYDVVSVDDALQVVSNPTPNWLLYNTFRSQAPTPTQGNAFFVDIRHNLPLTGADLITGTITPVPVSATADQVHWLYAQQDREAQKISQLTQTLMPALQPGEARPISTGSIIEFTRNNNTTVVTIPPLYVSAPHIIAITPDTRGVTPATTTAYTVTVSNAFSTTQTINLAILGLPAAWITLADSVTLASGETVDLPLTVAVPADAASQSYTLLAQALPAGGGEDVTSAILDVQPGPSLSVSPDLQYARNGETVVYDLVLTNTTNQAEQYTFSTDGLGSLPVALPSPVALNAGETFVGVFTVTAQAEESTLPFTVQATGATGLTASDEAGLGLLDGPGVAALLTPASATAGRGTPAIYDLVVTNSGSMPDVYTFAVNLPAGWSYELLVDGVPVTELALTPFVFNSATLRLLVTPDVNATPAAYPVQVVVSSQGNPATTAVADATALVAAEGVQVSIAPQSVTMSPTDAQVWDVTVTNTGQVADTFRLSAAGIVSATAQFSSPSVALAPNASTVVQLSVPNLDFALPTTYPFAVTARSTGNPAIFNTDDADITFTGFEDVAVSITPTLRVVDGYVADHQFLLVITNTGNVGTFYTLDTLIAPNGFAAPAVSELYIPAHQAAAVRINVSVSSAGTYNITVQAQSTTTAAAAAAAATLIINSLNDPPTAVDDSATTPEDTPITVDVLANDSDPNGDALTVSGVTQPTHGVVVNNGADVTYTPDADYNGPDSFTYTISDGNGGTDTATVSLTIAPVNDAPVALNDSDTTLEDVPVTIDVLANDTDVDGDALTVSAMTQPTHGGVVNNGTDVTYTPDADYNGLDSFTYTVNDGHGGTDTATVAVIVTAVGDAPIAMNDSATTPEDTPVTIDVLANDFDGDGDPLTVTAVSTATHGTVALNPDSSVTYTPDADYHGSDSFTYTVSDGNGGTDTATV